MKLSSLRVNPENPFPVKSSRAMKQLIESIKEDPEFLAEDKVVYDSTRENMVLGGNKRLVALRVIYGEDGECPDEWFADYAKYPEDKKRRFIFKDNASYGRYTMKFMTVEEASKHNIPLSGIRGKAQDDKGKVEFSEFLNEEHNYVVLYFETDVDWKQALTLLGLKTVSSKRTNGKPWSKGVGRVLNGPETLDKIRNS